MGKRNDTIAIIAVSAVALILVGSAMYAVSGMIGNGADRKTEAINSVSNADKKDAINQGGNKNSTSQPAKQNSGSDTMLEKNKEPDSTTKDSIESLVSSDDVYNKFISSSANDVILYSNNYATLQMQVEDSKDITLTKDDKTYKFKPPVDATLYDSLEIDFYDDNNGMCLVSIDGAAGSTYYDVYITHDGGSKWDNITTQAIAGHISRIFMVGEKDAYVISTGSAYMTDIVYYTHDGGKSWTLVENDLMSIENGVIYPLFISDDSNVVAIVQSDKEEIISMTIFKTDNKWEISKSRKLSKDKIVN